ncbi:helix-turn-helix domain-containing protein [Puniceibacterium antarcticum]|nr:helix-turn-helix domain-containing protein [Puniceibacterium antarcticum]
MLIGLSGALLMRTADTVPQEHYQAAQIKEPVVFPDPKEAQAILASVEAALAKGLYRDPDLTLQRLARRTGLTARKISQAVNQARGCSVSDLVNGYRVREAMRLLKESDQTVTQVMLDAGFQTKSNFNRAFRAFAGQTPTVYRRSESG